MASALAVLRSTPIEPPDRSVPLTYSGVTGGRRAGGRTPAGAACAGPLSAALAGQRAGAVSSVDLVEACLAAIEERDAGLAAVVEVHAEEALLTAKAADRAREQGHWRGALHGIPVTIKDIIDVAGFHTRAGSAAYDRLAERDAESVRRLRAAGAVVLAKVSTHEFALGVTTPQSRNPHDPERIPGGSSGGSAISVATGMALASLGTDTRASIRVPAALTGVVGLKATYAAVPTSGIVSLSWTMDHVAPMAATVGDAALMLGVLLDDPQFSSAGAAAGAPLRVGVAAATMDGAEPAVASAVHAALDALVAHGAELRDVGEPSAASLDLASAAGLVVSRCEAAAVHRSLALDRSRYTAEVADQLSAADHILATDYLDAQRVRGALVERLATAFATVDVLAMPTSPLVAPRVADCGRYLVRLARNAIPWSLVGFPAMSVPVGMAGGLPVGLQLVAPAGREDLLVAAGLALERAVGVAGRPEPSPPRTG